MQYWLIKSEPSSWSWQDQLDAGEGGTHWDGVRNYQASNNMKAMKKGDRCFFYHSVKEKSIVGIVEVIREYYPDHTDEKGRFGMVDVKAVQTMPSPVSLAQIKAEEKLGNLALLRQSRLSVVPIDPASWELICEMGGL
ncbi:EVE domain-containing protein [Sneathiella sp. P13V-1]|uniref:EVE domain-containing protein n=1 Tax=Sneathiella sp. P13V-1 TaxID=2697366 RepID=UPI00187B8BC9|nr:EVE domain-containing protein [Sneathiella sp. P13V-1]MBE7636241.1 EVE domain-containing protein [Sneathiella sp. P13V-1]